MAQNDMELYVVDRTTIKFENGALSAVPTFMPLKAFNRPNRLIPSSVVLANCGENDCFCRVDMRLSFDQHSCQVHEGDTEHQS